MDVDRPDATEGTALVPVRVLQLEAGATTTNAKYAPPKAATINSFGEGLLRFGASRWLELRLETPTYNTVRYLGTSFSGVSDMAVGVKVPIFRRVEATTRALPAISVLLGTSLPTGARQFKAETYEPGGIVAASWELADRAGFAANYGIARRTAAGEKFWVYTASGALGVALSDRIGSFVEVFGFKDAEIGSWRNNADGGLTFSVTPDLQLDARYSESLNAIKLRSVGVGFATRW
jgi:hypothetical protein